MRPVRLTDRTRIPSRTRKGTRARLGHNHSKVFSPQRLPSNGSEGLRDLRTMHAPSCKFYENRAGIFARKRGQAPISSIFSAFLRRFARVFRHYETCGPPETPLRPCRKTQEFTSCYQFKVEKTFRNSAVHLTRIKFCKKKKSPADGSNVRPAGLQRVRWAQQIRGSCSPASQSTVRRPPMRVTISTMPAGTSASSVTRPILAAFSP